MSNIDLSEQELIRRSSLQRLRDLGINPYPANQFKINVTANQILTTFNPEIPNLQDLMKYLCKNGFEHHVAMVRGNVAGILEEAIGNYLGWELYSHK